MNVAVAAIRYVHLNADIAQSQNITGCQHSTSKFDIVQQCCGTLIWVSWLKSDIIPVLLDEAADVIEGLVESVPAKLPKTQAEVLDHFVNHVLRPSWRAVSRKDMRTCTEKGDQICWGREKMYALLSMRLTSGNMSAEKCEHQLCLSDNHAFNIQYSKTSCNFK